MPGARAALRALVGAWGPGLCAATAQAMTLLPETVDASRFDCLTRVEGAPSTIEYPERERFEGTGGTVRVRMEFLDQRKGPLVEVLASPNDALSWAVRRFVDDYRLPCFKKSEQRAFAIQEFAFHPRDARPVTWAHPVVVGQVMDDCKLVGFEKARSTRYPSKAMREGKEGRILGLVTFDGPGVPAKVTILHGGGHRALDEAMVAAMEQVSLECASSGGQWPRRAMQLFVFQIAGEARTRFKDQDLKTFVTWIDQLDSHKVRFDFDSMSCPFEVEFHLYQPYGANAVGEVGKTDPNRQALLTWLRSVALRLPPKLMDEVLGRSLRIAVPCGLLDLTS